MAEIYPQNFYSYAGPIPGTVNLRWDFPQEGDRKYLGVNLYRSYYSPFTHFTLVNPEPIAVNTTTDNMTFRRYTENPIDVQVAKSLEDPETNRIQLTLSKVPESNFLYSQDAFNMAQAGTERTTSDLVQSLYNSIYIKVLYDSTPAFVIAVHDNKVIIDDRWVYEPTYSGVAPDAIVDYDPTDTTRWSIEYWTTDQSFKAMHYNDVYYRLMLVDLDGKEIGDLKASPLARLDSIDRIDYMWEEALRRNFWLIWFGGEDCFVYLRKWAGRVCSCEETGRFRCHCCYGTGVEGGYYGPFQVKVLFQDIVQMNNQTAAGRRNQESSRSIHIPMPVLHKGDVIVRRNGKRMVLGDMTNVTVRGTLLQQEFDLETTEGLKTALPLYPNVHPFEPLNIDPGTPPERITRSNSPTYENINYGLIKQSDNY